MFLTRQQIDQSFLANVASLRGKPSDANDGSLTGTTASSAVDVSAAVSRGARIPPNVRVPQDVWRVPEGYWGRYGGTLVLQKDDRLVVDGRLVPMSVDLTERLIAVTCTATYNFNIGHSGIAAPVPTTGALFPAGSVQMFRAGPGLATHFRIVATGDAKYTWWVADGQSV